MGVHDDEALLSLAEDLRQPDSRQLTAAEHIVKGETGPHRGQLVRVTHKDQTFSLRDSLQQAMQQLDIHHGHLVHDHHIRLQRIGFIPCKNHFAGVLVNTGLQQPVNGGGILSGHLGQTLGRTARRRRQKALQLHLSQQRQQAVEDGGFTGTGSAGDQQQAGAGSIPDGTQLLVGIGDAAEFFH